MIGEVRQRVVLGADPYQGLTVLLSESAATYYHEVIDIVSASTTMREFFESMASLDDDSWREQMTEFADDFGEDGLDEAFDVEKVPGFGDGYFPPDPRTLMVDDFDDDMWELLDGAVEHLDAMGSNPMVTIDDDNVDEIRRRLSSAGVEVIGWEELR